MEINLNSSQDEFLTLEHNSGYFEAIHLHILADFMYRSLYIIIQKIKTNSTRMPRKTWHEHEDKKKAYVDDFTTEDRFK